MIDLDRNVYLLEEGDLVAQTVNRGDLMLSHIEKIGSDRYRIARPEHKILKGEEVSAIKKSNEWIPTMFVNGAFANDLFLSTDYSEGYLYAIKPETTVFNSKHFTAYLFDKHKKLREEFPEIKGIF